MTGPMPKGWSQTLTWGDEEETREEADATGNPSPRDEDEG